MTPARVGEEHRVATTREDVEFVEERVAVCRVRPAMDLEDERPLPRRIELARLHEPALDHPAIRARELDALGCRDEPGCEELVVQAACFAHGPADLADEEIPGVSRRRADGGEATPRVVERPRHELMAPHRFGA